MKKIGLMVVDNSVIKQLKELIIKNIDSEYRIIEIHDKEMLFTKKMDFCIIEDSFDNQGINYAKTLIENNNDMLVLIISKDGSTIFDAVGINIPAICAIKILKRNLFQQFKISSIILINENYYYLKVIRASSIPKQMILFILNI